jgi:hypothetical protein
MTRTTPTTNGPFWPTSAAKQSFAPRHVEESILGCLEDKPKEWDVPGKYACKKCRATSNKKNKICKPVKTDKKK